MNAYELANELENYVWMNPNNNRDYCKEVKDILRQQADRIAELEKQSKFQVDNKVNAEPVAWWCAKEYADSDMEGGHVEELEFNQPSIYDPEGLIWEKPLYTHPAKTLTGAEQDACFNRGYKEGARDILNRQTDLTDEEFNNIFANGKRLGILETEDRFRNAMNLTDEEAIELWDSIPLVPNEGMTGRLKLFARAILRKAQEK